jgi:hypothetical protein
MPDGMPGRTVPKNDDSKSESCRAGEETGEVRTNYLAIFAMGVTFVGAGVVFLAAVNPVVGIFLIGVGVANMIVGIIHKEQWRT